jgi:protein MpaA
MRWQNKPILTATIFAILGLVIAALVAPNKPAANGCIETRVIGQSVNGRDITLCHVGGSHIGAKNSILVIGSIHGTELAGLRVVDEIIAKGAIDSDLWVIRNANPDGAIADTRQNANGVDLNRNFPTNWLPSDPTAGTFSGYSPASEPETQALMRIIDELKPRTVITMHQPYGLIDCAFERDNSLSKKLSDLTGLPMQCIPGEWSGSTTNTYTGTISIWVNKRYSESTALAFEIGDSITSAQIEKYAEALRKL